MSDLAVHYSSARHDWRTPTALFERLNAEFHFTVDAAADATNHLCPHWYGDGGERPDALTDPWDPTVTAYWCNPPYGRQQADFVKQSHDVMTRGGRVVMLLPARTDTRLFHTFIWDRETCEPYAGVEVRFLKGRLTFQSAPAAAPFPSMVVVFDGR